MATADSSDGRRRRAIWNLADQALSSLSNAAMSIVVANVTTKDEFGRFALAFSVFVFTSGWSKSVSAVPYVISSAGRSRGQARTVGADAAGLAFVLGVASGAVCVLVGLLWRTQYSPSLIAMGLTMPGVFLQDFWRNALIARGRPQAATLNDFLWLVAQVGAFVGVLTMGRRDPVSLILAWGVPGWLAAGFGIAQWKARPQLAGLRAHWASQWSVARYLAAEYLAIMGTVQIGWLLLPSVTSAAVVGAFRGTQTLLGPLNIFSFALSTFVLTELVRHGRPTGRHVWRSTLAVTVALVAVDGAWGAFLLLMPHSWGQAVLGDTWPITSTILGLMVVSTILLALSVGPIAGMRAYADTRRTFQVYTVFGISMLIMVLAGGAWHGARGAALGYVVAPLIFAPVWWVALRNSIRAAERDDAGQPDDAGHHAHATPG